MKKGREITNITVKVDILKHVTIFSFLGRVLTDDRRSETERQKRTGMMKNTFNKMNRILTYFQYGFYSAAVARI